MDRQRKLLSCIFDEKVLCSWRKSEDFRPMERCFTCKHYLRFMREMEEEDQRLDDGIEKLHKLRACWERGEISEEEFRKQYDIIDRQMDGVSGS